MQLPRSTNLALIGLCKTVDRGFRRVGTSVMDSKNEFIRGVRASLTQDTVGFKNFRS